MLTIKSSFSNLTYKKHEIYLRSIVLSLYICYYIRLIDKGHRTNYINEIFKGYDIPFNKIIKEITLFTFFPFHLSSSLSINFQVP